MSLVVESSADLQIKDPAEVMDYTLDWAKYLGSDTIASGSASVGAGITKDSETHSGTVSTIWLSGGSNGVAYPIAVTITTVAGRTWKRTFTVTVGTRTV